VAEPRVVALLNLQIGHSSSSFHVSTTLYRKNVSTTVFVSLQNEYARTKF
jgi:hypothetical protein